MVAATAQASSVCYEQIESALIQEIEANGWSFHGVDEYSAEDLTQMLSNVDDWSNELYEEEVAEIAAYVAQGTYEFYSVTGTGDYSGGYQELIVADPNNQCAPVARYLTYAE